MSQAAPHIVHALDTWRLSGVHTIRYIQYSWFLPSVRTMHHRRRSNVEREKQSAAACVQRQQLDWYIRSRPRSMSSQLLQLLAHEMTRGVAVSAMCHPGTTIMTILACAFVCSITNMTNLACAFACAASVTGCCRTNTGMIPHTHAHVRAPAMPSKNAILTERH
jgi:hypothetical protein